MKRFFTVCILLVCALSLPGKIRFTALDLADDNRLLIKAVSSAAENPEAGALFLADLDTFSVVPVSVVPEKMDLVDGVLFIRSVYGVQRIPVGKQGSAAFPSGALPLAIPGFPLFSGGTVPGSLVESISPSGDGKWILFVEPVSFGRGNLVLVETGTGITQTIANGVDLPGKSFPASWSPDSRGFIYAREGKLYYYPALSQSTPPADYYRLIGEGAVNSVYWSEGGNFYYLKGSTVYRVRSAELFARTPYSHFLETGEVKGRVPFEFDPNFDLFWIDSRGESLILAKGGRTIFYFPLGEEFGRRTAEPLPYVVFPRSSSRIEVLWSAQGIITVLAAPAGGESAVFAYRLNAGSLGASFEPVQSPPALSCSLSPDGSRVCFWGKNGIELYDYERWESAGKISPKPASIVLWASRNELITAGPEKIEWIKFPGGTGRQLSAADISERRLICLSAVNEFGFEKNGKRIAARLGNAWYTTDGVSPWIEGPPVVRKEHTQASSSYRVYLERSYGFFENIPMVRNIDSVGTLPLLSVRTGRPVREAAGDAVKGLSGRIAVPDAEGLFSHGSRAYRELALCFDLYDDDTGLSTVLDALSRFGIRATFFLNGEFIRRHPQAAKEIAAAGHETASMFCVLIDLSDSRYRIDRDFVSRGLARNEDEFFKATGGELGLLWHPPYYAVSPEISSAAGEAGYRTIGRDIDPRDWIVRDDVKRIAMEQPKAADMIDSIMDAKQEGSIIPVRLGLLPGGREEYLFNSIEVLLDTLIRDGYEIVTVSDLIGRSRK